MYPTVLVAAAAATGKGEAQVGDLGRPIVVMEDVGRLLVPVDDGRHGCRCFRPATYQGEYPR
jgi:hypothetical protein